MLISVSAVRPSWCEPRRNPNETPSSVSCNGLKLGLNLRGNCSRRPLSSSPTQIQGPAHLGCGDRLSFGQQTIKPFPVSNSLRIVGILNLDPRKRVRAALGLADHSFQVLLTHQLEELHCEFERRGATICQSIMRKPWGNRDFRVQDSAGNILKFTEPI